jgi:predicted MFS family arabinose efflux permease
VTRAVVGGCALGLAVGWNVSDVGAIADTVAVDYGVSLTTVGLFTTALFVVHAALQIPAGRMVDAHGARRVGLAALAVLAVANALALIAPSPELLFVARAAMGIGTALGFVAGSDYVRAQGGTVFAQGLYGGVALGAGGVALAAVPQLAGPLGFRAAFVSALVLAVLAGAVLALGPRDRPRHAERAARPVLADAPGLVRDSRLHRLCVLYMASFGFSVVLGNWVVPLLTRAADYSEGLAGAVGSLILAAGIVSRPLGGWIARVHPDRVKAALAASFVASAAGTLVLASAGPPALSALAALLLGLAAGIPFAASFGAAARVRPDAPAAAIAMVNMAANLVIVAGTPLVGLSFSLPGDGRIGFAAAAVLWLAALLVLPSVRELEPQPAR